MAKMQIRMAGLVPSAAAAGLVVIVSAALAGCGPVRAGTAHPAAASHPSTGRPAAAPVANGPVCQSPAAVSEVRVTRIPSLSQLGQSKPLPRVAHWITVRDPGKARALASAICGLPAMPHGVISCPDDPGGGYRLVFIAAGRVLYPVTVDAAGCQTVTGAGSARVSPSPARWVMRTPGFWAAFAHLTGIQDPAHSP